MRTRRQRGAQLLRSLPSRQEIWTEFQLPDLGCEQLHLMWASGKEAVEVYLCPSMPFKKEKKNRPLDKIHQQGQRHFKITKMSTIKYQEDLKSETSAHPKRLPGTKREIQTDKRANPPRRQKNLKCMCIKHQNFKIHEAKAGRTTR